MERKFLPTPEVDGNNELMIYVNIYPLPAKKTLSSTAEECSSRRLYLQLFLLSFSGSGQPYDLN
jgi:hypothetical protein